MAKRNRAIADDYAAYSAHIDAPKLVDVEFVISEEKPNHRSSYIGTLPVQAQVPYGATSVVCEVRDMSLFNYSFSYLSDKNKERTLARFDAGDGTHKNRAPGIPLDCTSVPTPHLHRYRDDGYLIAYPIDGVDYSSEESVKFDFEKGYSYLCETLSLGCADGRVPAVAFQPKDRLALTIEETDPNSGCNFNEIDD